jgi:hypothetical protein
VLTARAILKEHYNEHLFLVFKNKSDLCHCLLITLIIES